MLNHIGLAAGDPLLENDKKTVGLQAAVRDGSSSDVLTMQMDVDDQHAASNAPVDGSIRGCRSSPKPRKPVVAKAALSAEMRKVSGRQKRANLKFVDFVS